MSDDAGMDPIFFEDVAFLTVEQVNALHEEAIRRYSPGESLNIRDAGLLESAVATPQQTWGGEYLYGSIEEMAAAYLIGLNQNHAYENGNKRVAFAACSTFLRMNGYHLILTEDEAVELTLEIACGRMEREQVVEIIRNGITVL